MSSEKPTAAPPAPPAPLGALITDLPAQPVDETEAKRVMGGAGSETDGTRTGDITPT